MSADTPQETTIIEFFEKKLKINKELFNVFSNGFGEDSCLVLYCVVYNKDEKWQIIQQRLLIWMDGPWETLSLSKFKKRKNLFYKISLFIYFI